MRHPTQMALDRHSNHEQLLPASQCSGVSGYCPANPLWIRMRWIDSAMFDHEAPKGVYNGITPRACRPYRARTKGKDERMVGCIKGNFFVRYRSFESWAHLNQLAEKWLAEEADPRLQGTVKEVDVERFERERPALKPLSKGRYDTSYYEWRRVAWDGYIDVRDNRFSVPAELVGQHVAVAHFCRRLDHSSRLA